MSKGVGSNISPIEINDSGMPDLSKIGAQYVEDSPTKEILIHDYWDDVKTVGKFTMPYRINFGEDGKVISTAKGKIKSLIQVVCVLVPDENNVWRSRPISTLYECEF